LPPDAIEKRCHNKQFDAGLPATPFVEKYFGHGQPLTAPGTKVVARVSG
jgi:hypothetical protein